MKIQKNPKMSIKQKMLLGQINHFTVFLRCEKFYFSQINMIMNNGSFGKITLPRIGSSLNVFFFGLVKMLITLFQLPII
jgi:hypothetical protein